MRREYKCRRECRAALRALLVAALLLGGLLPRLARAQQVAAPADTSGLTGGHLLPEAVVEAARLGHYAVGTRRTVLDSTALRLYPAGTLADVLAARTPIYLKNYGPGQLSSITLRGTSARHTAVLWHGFNINLPSLGEADFALLPTTGATRVEVQHGPAAATYGNGAIGGAVLLSAPVRWEAGPRGQAQADGGSFGLRAGSLESSFSNEKLALRTAAAYREAQNDFPYPERVFGGTVTRRQVNAAFRQWSVAQDATFRLSPRDELTAAVWLTDADRGIQPAIGSANDRARERDQSRRLLAGYRRVARRHETGVRVAWFEDVLNYSSNTVLSNSRVRTTQAQADHAVRFGPTLSLRVGAQIQHYAAQVDGYGRAITENRFAGYGLLRYDPRPTLHLTLNVRQALLPHRQPPLTPTIGAEWQLWQAANQELTAKGSASRSYRAPTLNERYWRPGGNPDLQPETSLGYEGGLLHTWRPTSALTLETELTAYRQQVENWVQWLPNANLGYWAPRNLRRVRAQGLEASSALTWRPGAYSLTARAAYHLTQSRKVRGATDDPDPVDRQLPYVPLHAAALSTDHAWHGWQLTTTLTYTGPRYLDASATTSLPGYALLNATLGYRLRLTRTFDLTALAQGYNLTNQVYRSYAAQALPGRNGQLSLRLSWH